MEIAELILEYIKVLAWPMFALVTVLLFRKQLLTILNRIEKAGLPGGVSIDFREEIKEVKRLSDKVEAAPPPEQAKNAPSIPLTEANARLISLGLQPSPSGLDVTYYRNLTKQDPNLALAAIRIEVDIALRNLAAGFAVDANSHDMGQRLARKLRENGALTNEQLQLINKILQITNLAVHGKTLVSIEEANAVIDTVEVLLDQFIYWLSWGFDDDWFPSSMIVEK